MGTYDDGRLLWYRRGRGRVNGRGRDRHGLGGMGESSSSI